jgi:hypothetical protein
MSRVIVIFFIEYVERRVYRGVNLETSITLFVSTGREARIMMNVIYNSDNYCVVEYPAEHGIELVDKRCARGTFLQGDLAERFAQSMQDAVAEEPTAEHIDEFLDGFDRLLSQPVVYH